MNAPAAAIPARVAVSRFVWTHVRQALQQVVAAGAISPYRAAACVKRPFQTVCIDGSVRVRAVPILESLDRVSLPVGGQAIHERQRGIEPAFPGSQPGEASAPSPQWRLESHLRNGPGPWTPGPFAFSGVAPAVRAADAVASGFEVQRRHAEPLRKLAQSAE